MVLLKLSAVSPGHSETDPKIKGSAYAAQTLLASYRDELVGYFQLRSQQCGWRPATQGSAWQLQMRPRGGRDAAGAAGALGLHWASASSLKWFLQDGRWRTTRSRSCIPTAQSAAPEESTSWALNHPRIIWLLSRQVPPVKSKRALPDGKTDNAQYVLVHSVWQTRACHKWSSRSRLQIQTCSERGSPFFFFFVLSWHLIHCNYFTVTCQHEPHDLFDTVSSNTSLRSRRDQAGLLKCAVSEQQ